MFRLDLKASKNFFERSLFPQRGGEFVEGSCFRDAHGFIEIGFARRTYADFARLALPIPAPLRAVWIDQNISPERVGVLCE